MERRSSLLQTCTKKFQNSCALKKLDIFICGILKLKRYDFFTFNFDYNFLKKWQIGKLEYDFLVNYTLKKEQITPAAVHMYR